MWEVVGTPTSGEWLCLEPIAVLYEFDGPRIFTCKSASGDLFLAYQCGEEKPIMRFLVVPFGGEMEKKLTEGQIDLHDALMRRPAWLFDISYQWQCERAWQVEVEKLPVSSIPRPGVMLGCHLTPIINPLPIVHESRLEEV